MLAGVIRARFDKFGRGWRGRERYAGYILI